MIFFPFHNMYAAELINYALTLTSSISFIHTTQKSNRNRMIPQKGGGSFGLFWKIVAMFLPFVSGVFQRFVLWTLCIYAPLSAGAFHLHHSSSTSRLKTIITTSISKSEGLGQGTSSASPECLPKISTSNLPQMRTGFGIGSFTGMAAVHEERTNSIIIHPAMLTTRSQWPSCNPTNSRRIRSNADEHGRWHPQLRDRSKSVDRRLCGKYISQIWR